MVGKEIFFLALEEIKREYPDYEFMVSRDVTWILQKKMNRLIEEKELPFELYQDYPLEKGCREHKENELVLVTQGTNYKDLFSGKAQAELVIRVLFEPSRLRQDICVHHLPKVLVTQLTENIRKVQSLVESNKSKEAVSILIDEYSRHRHQVSQDHQVTWTVWGDYEGSLLNLSVLIAQF